MTRKEHAEEGIESLPHVVIVGGGFGGLCAALALSRRAVRVTLVDRNNYHLFQPLLYQVATASLSAGDIASPIRSILSRAPRVRTLLAEVTSIDLPNHRVLLNEGELHYDHLIVAAGSSTSYFGHDRWQEVAPTLKTLDDALAMRARILNAFEQAERTTDEAIRQALLTFVVIGGGPTGVEMAGAIVDIARRTLKRDFRSIDPTQARIVLVEAAPHVLATYPEDLSASAERQLQRLGVEVRTGVLVTEITSEFVQVGEEKIATRNALWTAGVVASPLANALGVPLVRGKVPVEPELNVPGYEEAYVVGDMAYFVNEVGDPLPGVAQVAMQQGRAAAENIWRTVQGQPRRPFRYKRKPLMAIIGRSSAVGDMNGVHVAGPFAWLTWLLVHLYFLIGFDNRVLVLVSWMWSYFTHQRGVRLITGAARRDKTPRSDKSVPA